MPNFAKKGTKSADELNFGQSLNFINRKGIYKMRPISWEFNQANFSDASENTGNITLVFETEEKVDEGVEPNEKAENNGLVADVRLNMGYAFDVSGPDERSQKSIDTICSQLAEMAKVIGKNEEYLKEEKDLSLDQKLDKIIEYYKNEYKFFKLGQRNYPKNTDNGAQWRSFAVLPRFNFVADSEDKLSLTEWDDYTSNRDQEKYEEMNGEEKQEDSTSSDDLNF